MLFEVTESFKCTDSIGFVISNNVSAMDNMANQLRKQFGTLQSLRCGASVVLFISQRGFFLSQCKGPAY